MILISIRLQTYTGWRETQCTEPISTPMSIPPISTDLSNGATLINIHRWRCWTPAKAKEYFLNFRLNKVSRCFFLWILVVRIPLFCSKWACLCFECVSVFVPFYFGGLRGWCFAFLWTADKTSCLRPASFLGSAVVWYCSQCQSHCPCHSLSRFFYSDHVLDAFGVRVVPRSLCWSLVLEPSRAACSLFQFHSDSIPFRSVISTSYFI